jgi:hypothetical protein
MRQREFVCVNEREYISTHLSISKFYMFRNIDLKINIDYIYIHRYYFINDKYVNIYIIYICIYTS